MTNLQWLLGAIGDGIIQFKIDRPTRLFFNGVGDQFRYEVEDEPPMVILQLNPDWCYKEREE